MSNNNSLPDYKDQVRSHSSTVVSVAVEAVDTETPNTSTVVVAVEAVDTPNSATATADAADAAASRQNVPRNKSHEEASVVIQAEEDYLPDYKDQVVDRRRPSQRQLQQQLHHRQQAVASVVGEEASVVGEEASVLGEEASVVGEEGTHILPSYKGQVTSMDQRPTDGATPRLQTGTPSEDRRANTNQNGPHYKGQARVTAVRAQQQPPGNRFAEDPVVASNQRLPEYKDQVFDRENRPRRSDSETDRRQTNGARGTNNDNRAVPNTNPAELPLELGVVVAAAEPMIYSAASPVMLHNHNHGGIVEATAVLVQDLFDEDDNEEKSRTEEPTEKASEEHKVREAEGTGPWLKTKKAIAGFVAVLVLLAGVVGGVCGSGACGGGDISPDYPIAFTSTEELYAAVDEYVATVYGVATSYDGDISDNSRSNVTVKYGPIGDWDVSGLQNLSLVFYRGDRSSWYDAATIDSLLSTAMTTPFQEDISRWNTSRVTTMEGMLVGAVDFNQDLSAYDTSRVTNMRAMFLGCTSYMGQGLSNWDTGSVIDMTAAFLGASVLDADLSQWQVGKVTSMQAMFQGCGVFDAGLEGWNTGQVTSMASLFRSAKLFNSDLSAWDTRSVTDMAFMFYNAETFDRDLSAWDTSSVTVLDSMFELTKFNGDISTWDTSQVTSMVSMFQDSTFNGVVSGWTTSRVTNMISMFQRATGFAGSVSAWDTTSVTDMSYMFSETQVFSSDLSSWNTGRVVDMSRMFSEAQVFSSVLSSWNTERVADMSFMFYDTPSFNSDLPWNVSNVKTMSHAFSNAVAFAGDVSNWDTSICTSMNAMFQKAFVFDGDVSNWNTARVEQFSHMFELAEMFNSDLSQWDVSNAVSTSFMFREANEFNSDISSWNLASANSMDRMFKGAAGFNQNLCPWGTRITNALLLDTFQASGCDNTNDPDPNNYDAGPWCQNCIV